MRMLVWLWVGLWAPGALAQAPAPAPAEAAPPRALRVAVMDFEVSDIDPTVARITSESLLQEIRKLERVSVISLDEVRAMLSLEEQRLMAGCEASSCLADIAGALGADVVVIGSLAKVGDEHVIGLRAIDQNEGAALGSYSARLTPAGGEEFLAAVGPAVAEIFPGRGLREGQTRGVSDEVALRLHPPPLDPWTVYSAGGVGAGFAALAVVGLGLNLLFGGVMSAAVADAGPDGGSTIDKRQLDALFTATNVSLGAAAVAGAGALAGFGGAALLALFTDWDGSRAASAQPE